MPAIRHMAICTENNRRLARFYHYIFGMDEVWNYEQNSPYAFYVSDGSFNLNCLQIHNTMAEQKRDVGINHYGFKVESIKEIGDKLGQLNPPIKFADRPKDGRYTEIRIKDPDGNGVDIAEKGWGAEEGTRNPGVRHVGIRTGDLERLADFYKFVFGMKEVGRSETASARRLSVRRQHQPGPDKRRRRSRGRHPSAGVSSAKPARSRTADQKTARPHLSRRAGAAHCAGRRPLQGRATQGSRRQSARRFRRRMAALSAASQHCVNQLLLAARPETTRASKWQTQSFMVRFATDE